MSSVMVTVWLPSSSGFDALAEALTTLSDPCPAAEPAPRANSSAANTAARNRGRQVVASFIRTSSGHELTLNSPSEQLRSGIAGVVEETTHFLGVLVADTVLDAAGHIDAVGL